MVAGTKCDTHIDVQAYFSPLALIENVMPLGMLVGSTYNAFVSISSSNFVAPLAKEHPTTRRIRRIRRLFDAGFLHFFTFGFFLKLTRFLLPKILSQLAENSAQFSIGLGQSPLPALFFIFPP